VANGQSVLTEDAFQSFISHLVTRLHVAASTQNRAFASVLFLYRVLFSQTVLAAMPPVSFFPPPSIIK